MWQIIIVHFDNILHINIKTIKNYNDNDNDNDNEIDLFRHHNGNNTQYMLL